MKTLNLRYAQALERFLKLLPQESKVIDFYAGKGHYAEEFLRFGCEIVAMIDPLEKYNDIQLKTYPWMDQARRGMTIIGKGLEDIVIPYRSINGIWISSSMANQKKSVFATVIGRMYDWLEPGGIVSFTLPEGEGYKIMKEEGVRGTVEKLIMYYQPDEIEKLLQSFGYTTVDAWYEGSVQQRWIQVIAKR